MYRRLVSVLVLICCVCITASAAVSVTAATGGTNICSNKAVTGSAPAFTTLGPIVITEGANTDFSIGTSVIVLTAPTGWQFNTTLPTITYITGSNITGASGSITATTLTINVTVVNNNGADQLTITGLQVQPTTTSSSAGAIRASVATGVAGITTGSSGTNFGSLSVVAPSTATVSIAASPAGSFCPGTNITFTPTSANGGTPTYTWSLNGTDVSIGATYSNNTLTSGNTISCKMLSSQTCLVANPVFSNTITASVLTAPAALSGANTVCPTTTTTLTTTTTGGAWSSSNTAVGTVNTSGVVTGVAAGTANISYTAGGCAATKTIYVNNPPLAPALTPTVSTICNGMSMSIVAAGTPASSTILSQNFNSGLGSWTVDTAGSINIVSGAEWKACADSYLNEQGWYRSPDHSTFVMANADTSGSSSTLSAKLISPVFSLADYASATLTFQHAYDYWPAGDVYVNVEISTNGGATWTTLNNYTGAGVGSKMSFVSQTYSLNAYLGSANAKLRFYYKSTFGYYWALDNVAINGTPALVAPTWSPTTHLFTNSTLTTPYTTGTATNTVYVYPTTITAPTTIVYTATATMGACVASSTSTVNVNPEPGTTSGGLNVCVGTSTTLSNSASGGTWVSGNTAIATVGSASGIVTGVATGTVSISYISGSSCATVVVVTVNTTPAAIAGNLNVCLGYTSTLTDATTGGTWSSSNTSIATIGSASGIANGLAFGTATITYSLGAGCTATAVVTVRPLPAAVSGPSSVCATQTINLANSTTGGTWICTASTIATVGSSSGTVTGVDAGVASVSYVLTTTGCFAIKNVSVNPLGAIAGSANACLGYTSTYSNSATGGNWYSTNTSIATINLTTGVLTPVTTGTTLISYVLPTGCTAYKTVTVNALPADITGPTAVCVGATMTLANTTTGGFWSSASSVTAGVGASSGIVTGVGAGTTIITYTATTGCFKTYNITVNPPPASITGTATVCAGSVTVFSDATSGGAWSTSNAGVATVSGGTVTGVAAGTAMISYTLPTTCFAVRVVTVNPLPAAIDGTLAVCQGVSATLTNTTTGGTWFSSNTFVATIGATTGIVTGGTAGTSGITYTLPTGCVSAATITINTIPASITGSNTVCTGTMVTVATTTTGGSWSSSNTALATVGTSGIVTGVAAGNPLITYTLPTGCYAIKLMTVYASPAAISGSTNVCQDLTTTLTNTTTGGAWSSSNTSVATVAAGVVSGLTTGTTAISYIISTGCFAATVITVLPLPATISGNLNICLGATSALSNATSGGSWSSSNTSIATIGASSGVATGVVLGMVTISYTLSTGCYATATAVINPLPTAISGPTSLCVGAIMGLSNATTGGTWSSSEASIAAVGSASGIVSGVSAGTVNISYILPTGCPATKIVTVNPVPAAISGPDNICQASSATLSSPGWPGGSWSSNTVTVATIGSSTGLMYGAAGGGTIITYTLPSGCYKTLPVTVTSLPSPIAGSSSICVGAISLYTDITTGGSWISGNTSVATINSLGLLTGVSAGTTVVTYMLPLGCIATRTVTVNPLPDPISGITSLCLSSPVTLSSATTGGTWSSSNSSTAAIGSATGIVTGFIYGTAVISYTLSTGCFDTTVVSVNLTPSVIAGNSAVCMGLSTTYTNVVGGGAWSSSNIAVATVAAGGVVTGVAPGSAVITYTLSSGCFVIKNLTVHPLPATITGGPAICQGLSATMSNATAGGTWSSSNGFVASINAATGLVSGIAAGTANITYTLGTGCIATAVLTVHALPGALTGSGNVCLGSTSALSTTTGGGTWASSDVTVATVNASGVVSGIALGTSVITYTIGVGCIISRIVTVSSLPPAITGPTSTCVGVNISLSNSVAGGAWSSSATTQATVNAATGFVTPLSAGTVVISYTLPTGCYSISTILINTVTPITGNTALCIGAISTLSHAIPGGVWSSSNTAVAGIGASSGIAVGYSANTAIISYVIPGGCIATRVATVSPLPAAITGPSSVCPSFTITLSDVTPGGTWSSGNVTLATINPTTGVVTGISPGLVTMSYSMSSGCAVTKLITISPLPAAISGTSNICVGSSVTLTSGATGGVWSSNATAVATVGAGTGIVNGIAPGTAVISYVPVTGCAATTVVTVNGLPAAITGTTSLCAGNTGTLADAVPGGVWSSTNTVVATITTSGVVNALVPGTATVSYTSGIGCAATAIVTVNTMPSAITGVPSACVGFTTALSSAPTGGTWTSSNTAVAGIDAVTGLVAGVGAGTSIVSYSFSTGCMAQVVVTVSASASAVSGPGTVCAGSQITLTDPASAGGTWSTGSSSVATIGSATGVVTGVAAGTAGITYTIGAGCLTTRVITVDPLPAAITGLPSTCIGLTTTLASATSGGTWSSSFLPVGTVGAATGVVYGVTTGSITISYTLPTGCYATKPVSVNPMPVAIAGVNTVCAGLNTTLSDLIPGGLWSSTDIAVATVAAATGVVTGVAAGTTTISYLLGAGCAASTVVTVFPLPAAITGSLNICEGTVQPLFSATAGGSWTISSPSIATINVGTGSVTALAPGTATVTYTIGSGCIATAIITVNPVAPNTGTANTCAGYFTTLTNAIAGGTWSSSNYSIASVFIGSGVVTGITPGSATITYTLPTGCTATTLVTITSLSPVTGSNSVCVGQSVTMANAATGGTWTSGNVLVASVGSATGVVSGLAAGAAVISYLYSGGCVATKLVTIYPLSPVAGPGNVCAGQSITLTDATPGGSWSSSNTSIATIDAAGVVAAITAGTTTISYELATGCVATKVVTVNPLAAISGSPNLCTGTVSIYSNPVSGGTWASSNLSIVTTAITTGNITGVATGTATISYILPTGCFVTLPVTVNPQPSNITGTAGICLYASSTLSDATAGGTWVSSSSTIAAVGSMTGVVAGVNAGIAVISYILPTGCYRTLPVTVNVLPSAISGSLQVCEGMSTVLSNSIAGGTWSVAATTIAFIGAATGVVNGVTPGTTTITYMLSTGCYATAVVTVNSLPGSVSGPTSVCVGSSINCSSTTSGGTWSSADPYVTVDAASGVATGVNPGVAVVTYSLPTGCVRTVSVSVYPLPSAISGVPRVCVGAANTLVNATGGGTWSGSDASILTIDAATGVVSGVSAGTATVSYTIVSGCYVTMVVTVDPLPSAIVGSSTVCQGAVLSLASASAGGAWSSSAASVATVSAAGNVSGVSAGVANITYTLPTGCYQFAPVTVNPLPAVIVGPGVVCTGQSVSLTDATPSGVWISDATSIATVDAATGSVTGVSAGVTNISYSLATGCFRSVAITVNPSPAAITGPSQVCAGLSITLADVTPSGTWTSGSSTIATISSAGVVNGIAAGAVAMSYTLATGCRATFIVTVNPVPPSITGIANICPGSSVTLSNAMAGGSWSSTYTSIVTVDTTTGTVSGISAGLSVITYTMPTGCLTTAVILVQPAPAAVTGVAAVCLGANSTLSCATAGGTWVSSTPSVASVGFTSGAVSSLSAGTTTISYVLPSGCAATRIFTVNPNPPAIAGSPIACMSNTTTMANSMPGGLWTSSDVSVATINATTGIVTGVSLGTVNITYTLPTGCRTVSFISVYPPPATISGAAHICQGASTLLSSATAGGTWSSSAPAIAAVSSSGDVTGLSGGSATITYTLVTGCYAISTVTVDPLLPIVGSNVVCSGDTVTYTNGVPGGVWSSSTLSVATVTPLTGAVYGVAPGVAVISYFLPTGCVATKTVTVNQLPATYLVTGGGTFCTGGTGVPVGLNGSAAGFVYWLYNGSVAVGSLAGTGSSLSFGLQTTSGTYSVYAVNSATGCARFMLSTAVVSSVAFAPAAVSINSSAGDTVCNGSAVLFTPVSYLGGTAPTYQWWVNGMPVSGATSYSYSPANGDIVTCKLTSSASCAVPNIATSNLTMSVLPTVVPAVTAAVLPNDTVCALTAVSFTATEVNGGAAPYYIWLKNGLPATTGATYTYVPADGDVVSCKMAANSRCRTADTVLSNVINMKVLPYATPAVTINAVPGFVITSGEEVTFTAVVANAGATPSYQWKINNVTIAGATNASFTWSSFANSDTVKCAVTSSGLCGGVTTVAGEVMTVNNVGVHNADLKKGSVQLLPNPNKGAFILKGLPVNGGAATIVVYNVLGQVVYREEVQLRRGETERHIQLDHKLANGMYVLSLGMGDEANMFHFVVRK